MKERFFEDFMEIRMSDEDKHNADNYLRLRLPFYSKIVIQFDDEFDLDSIYGEGGIQYDDMIDISCCDMDWVKSQHIYYPTSKEAYAYIVEYFKVFDCLIFQFKFD